MINIEPSKGPKVPYNTDDEKPKTFQDELAVTANTVDMLEELGMPIEMSSEDTEQTKRLVDAAINNKKVANLKQPTIAFAAKEFLRQYATQVAIDIHETRSAITTKLMEIANCGDPRYELKALELLGKHSDIGLFTERSEVTVNYKSSSDLENAIKDRVKRLLNADVIDVVPISDNLDEELGTAPLDTFEEVPPDDGAGERDN
jgi:hypothetical protein